MNDCDPASQAEDSGDRDSAVIAAILRIGASPDLDTVLGAAVEGAGASQMDALGHGPGRRMDVSPAVHTADALAAVTT
ncbi:MAG: hypothetical protein OXU64_03980 [Gemmatimonadota bacterium]|nr:hypothetical protein [Gemmatimonadota bacterium]